MGGHPMTETFIALLFAHTLADFVFQTNWMVSNKHSPLALGLHAAVVLATAIAATGTLHPALVVLALVHIAIDVGKLILTRTWAKAGGLALFLIDQGLHLATLLALAFWLPGLWAGGLWPPGAIVTGDDSGILGTGLWSEAAPLPVSQLPALMVVTTGFILATRAGGFAVGLLMRPFADSLPGGTAAEGLPGAGRVIGLLERGLIFVLVLIGQPQGVGLLMAAKSILRYGALKEDRELSEYVIIGTLASFGWALVVSYATLAGLAVLPPLGILPATP